jgi:hypothetical protein
MAQWDINVDAIQSADRHYVQTLALPDLHGLTEGLLPRCGAALPIVGDARSRETYAEMIREVQDLLREIRFCTATAIMLLLDAAMTQPDPPSEPARSVPGLFITEAEMAVLLTNDGFEPPSTLATDRHRHIGGGQTLGVWFGGLLLDTALFKCSGLLDRLTVALWCHAQLPIAETKAGELKYPVFNKESIQGLAASYESEPAWSTYAALVDTPLAEELVRYRHIGIHKRRVGSALNNGLERWHADEVNPDSPIHKVTLGMSAIDHANAPLATYRELLVPALTAAAEMIRRRRPPGHQPDSTQTRPIDDHVAG